MVRKISLLPADSVNEHRTNEADLPAGGRLRALRS